MESVFCTGFYAVTSQKLLRIEHIQRYSRKTFCFFSKTACILCSAVNL